MAPEMLTVGEFNRSIDRLSQNITARFDRTDVKLDDHGDRLTTLETRFIARNADVHKTTRNNATGWGMGAAMFGVGVFKVVELIWK
jgi:hypothetical protein